MRLLIFLLSASACFGQLTVQQMEPFFKGAGVPSVFYPTNLPGVWIRWWVASDNPTNITITNWVDRVVAAQLTNTLALSPTNSALGMGFNGSTYLQWKDILTTDNNSSVTNVVFLIMQPITPSTDFSGVYGIRDVAQYSTGRGLMTRTTGAYQWNDGVFQADICKFTSGSYQDMAIVGPEATSTTSMLFYTNGILGFSAANAGWLTSRPHNVVGHNSNNNGNYKGLIQEMLVGTNIPIAQVTMVVSNLHWYATNTYHFTP